MSWLIVVSPARAAERPLPPPVYRNTIALHTSGLVLVGVGLTALGGAWLWCGGIWVGSGCGRPVSDFGGYSVFIGLVVQPIAGVGGMLSLMHHGYRPRTRGVWTLASGAALLGTSIVSGSRRDDGLGAWLALSGAVFTLSGGALQGADNVAAYKNDRRGASSLHVAPWSAGDRFGLSAIVRW